MISQTEHSQAHAAMEEFVEERANRVHTGSKRAWLDRMNRGFWENWGFEACIFSSLPALALILLYLEPILLFNDDWPPSPFNEFKIPGAIVISLLPASLISSWLLNLYISSKTPMEAAIPRWLLWLRLLGASLPIFGLFIVPAWKKILAQRSYRSDLSLAAPCTNTPQSQAHIFFGPYPLKRLYPLGPIIAWFIPGLLMPFALISWVITNPALTTQRPKVIVLICLAIHLGLTIMMAAYVRINAPFATKQRKLLTYILLLVSLFGLPGLMLSFPALVPRGSGEKTLTADLYGRRKDVTRISIWIDLRKVLSQSWKKLPWFRQWSRPTGLQRVEENGRNDLNVAALYRLKAFFLHLESVLLIIALSEFVSLIPAATPSINATIFWATTTAWVLLATGSLIQGSRILSYALRIPNISNLLSKHPYGVYLLVAGSAFLTGTQGAFLALEGKLPELGDFLSKYSHIYVFLLVIHAMFCLAFSPQHWRNRWPNSTVWFPLMILLVVLGGYASVLPAKEGGIFISSLFTRLMLILPILALISFTILGGWLLRPFSWQHVFDRSLPRRLRAALAFLIVTAILPLGGLAIPFWIYARHRLWPEFEPLIASRQPATTGDP